MIKYNRSKTQICKPEDLVVRNITNHPTWKNVHSTLKPIQVTVQDDYIKTIFY